MADGADDRGTPGVAEAMHAFLRVATDDDIARLARVISPGLDLTPRERRAGFEIMVRHIFSRAGETGPSGTFVTLLKDGVPTPHHTRGVALSADLAASFADKAARSLAGDGAVVTAQVSDLRETRAYRDGVLLQSGRGARDPAARPGPDEPLEPGEAVAFARDVHRPPHATVRAGATGVVEAVGERQVTVLLDEPVPGLEPWNNRVHWYPEFDRLLGATFDESVRADVETVAPAPAP